MAGGSVSTDWWGVDYGDVDDNVDDNVCGIGGTRWDDQSLDSALTNTSSSLSATRYILTPRPGPGVSLVLSVRSPLPSPAASGEERRLLLMTPPPDQACLPIPPINITPLFVDEI